VARFVVCAVLAFSFVSSSLSLAGASTTGNAMSCCAGKAAGHCSAGLQAKVRVKPKPEPMCGLKAGVTEVIVAEDPVPAASHTATNSDLITARIANPCRQDCCATASALSRKPTRREAATLAEASLLSPVSTQLLVESSFSPAAAERVLNQSPPRGPPTTI
jgi:hypothetical protein